MGEGAVGIGDLYSEGRRAAAWGLAVSLGLGAIKGAGGLLGGSVALVSDAAHVELYVAGRGSYFSRDGIELRARVETVGQVRAALLSVNNYYFIYADPATGLPYRAQVIAGAQPQPPAQGRQRPR